MYHQYYWAETHLGSITTLHKDPECLKNKKTKTNIRTTVIGLCTMSAGEAVVEDGWLDGLVDLASFTQQQPAFPQVFPAVLFLVSEGLRRQSRLQNPSGYCPQISRWWNGERDLWSSPLSDEKRFHHEQTATVMPAWSAGTMWVSMSPVFV